MASSSFKWQSYRQTPQILADDFLSMSSLLLSVTVDYQVVIIKQKRVSHLTFTNNLYNYK